MPNFTANQLKTFPFCVEFESLRNNLGEQETNESVRLLSGVEATAAGFDPPRRLLQISLNSRIFSIYFVIQTFVNPQQRFVFMLLLISAT